MPFNVSSTVSAAPADPAELNPSPSEINPSELKEALETPSDELMPPAPTAFDPEFVTNQMDILKGQLESSGKESFDIPDHLLPADLQNYISTLAKLVGYTDYDAQKVCTFRFFTYDDKTFLLPPSLMATPQGEPILEWGSEELALSPSLDIYDRSLFNFNPGSADVYPSLTVSPKTKLNFPINIRFDKEKTGDKSKIFAKLMDCETLADLAPFLKTNVKTQSLTKLGKDITFTLTGVLTKQREDKDDLHILQCSGEIIEAWLIGSIEEYNEVQFPCEASWLHETRTLNLICPNGSQFSIVAKSGYGKLKELEVGKLYNVVGYEHITGQYGEQTIIHIQTDDGKTQSFNAKTRNNTIVNRLKDNPLVDTDNPAKLTIVSAKPSQYKKGNETVNFISINATFILASDQNNPLMQTLFA